jgi:hydroxymethylpyrimidine pyrophosphatase-like HAD family hydrolase
MRTFKGIIALDIDGTLTTRKHFLAPHVAHYLNHLNDTGWCLLLITGRSFTYASKILEHFHSPLYCGVQNGSAIYEFPTKRQLLKSYLPGSCLKELDESTKEIKTPFIVELGYEQGDECFYTAHLFSPDELAYVHFRQQISLCRWTSVDSIATLPISFFAQGKALARAEAARGIESFFERRYPDLFKVTVLEDDCRTDGYIVHLNHKEANKGCAVQKFKKMIGADLPVISAGNDNNDFEIIRDAEVGIAMPGSPKKLLECAKILAKAGPEEGIVEALQEAIERI